MKLKICPGDNIMFVHSDGPDEFLFLLRSNAVRLSTGHRSFGGSSGGFIARRSGICGRKTLIHALYLTTFRSWIRPITRHKFPGQVSLNVNSDIRQHLPKRFFNILSFRRDGVGRD